MCYSIKVHASPPGRLWPAISSKPRENKAGAAEQATFDVLLTTDRSLPHEQNSEGRKTTVVILSKNRWSLVRPLIGQIVASVNAAKPGTFTVIEIPKK